MALKELAEKIKPVAEQVSVIYSQDEDSCSDDGMQFLELKTEDAGAGKYFILSTERWAFDSLEELVDLFNDFAKRL